MMIKPTLTKEEADILTKHLSGNRNNLLEVRQRVFCVTRFPKPTGAVYFATWHYAGQMFFEDEGPARDTALEALQEIAQVITLPF